jgi:hypothetical protein
MEDFLLSRRISIKKVAMSLDYYLIQTSSQNGLSERVTIP